MVTTMKTCPERRSVVVGAALFATSPESGIVVTLTPAVRSRERPVPLLRLGVRSFSWCADVKWEEVHEIECEKIQQ